MSLSLSTMAPTHACTHLQIAMQNRRPCAMQESHAARSVTSHLDEQWPLKSTIRRRAHKAAVTHCTQRAWCAQSSDSHLVRCPCMTAHSDPRETSSVTIAKCGGVVQAPAIPTQTRAGGGCRRVPAPIKSTMFGCLSADMTATSARNSFTMSSLRAWNDTVAPLR